MNQTPSTLQTSPKVGFKTPILHDIQNSTSALKFDWKNKWLKGEEYAYILKNIDLYCETFGMVKLPPKTHPPSIYTEPQDGMIYFVEGNSVGSDFGFPRVDIKKRYRWKKMNFTTDLPKKRPCVTYIVASAVKCGKFFPNTKEDGPSFRMHAVILNKEGVQTQKYKNKDTLQNFNCMEDPHSSLSTACSSITETIELEKGEHINDNDQDSKNKLKDKKNYVLCHVRKIDQNYRASKGSGKRENPFDDEEEEDDEIDPNDSRGFNRKVVSSQGDKQASIREDLFYNKSTNFSSIQKAIKSDMAYKNSTYKSPSVSNSGKSTIKLIKLNPTIHSKYEMRENKLNNFTPFQNFSTPSPVQHFKGKSQEEKNDIKSSNSKRSGFKDEFLSQLNQSNQSEFENVDYLKLLSELLNNKNC